jgi:hypothetical protein
MEIIVLVIKPAHHMQFICIFGGKAGLVGRPVSSFLNTAWYFLT